MDWKYLGLRISVLILTIIFGYSTLDIKSDDKRPVDLLNDFLLNKSMVYTLFILVVISILDMFDNGVPVGVFIWVLIGLLILAGAVGFFRKILSIVKPTPKSKNLTVDGGVNLYLMGLSTAFYIAEYTIIAYYRGR